MTRTRVLVIGAGPYGLAVANDLSARGVDFVVAGEPFELWRRHTLGSMLLRSGCGASEIYSHDRRYDLARFLSDRKAADSAAKASEKSTELSDAERNAIQNGDKWEHIRIPVTTFRDYLDDVTERLPFSILRQRITHLDRQGDFFTARGSEGAEIEAQAVVVATGLGGHQHLPPVLEALPANRLLHAWQTPEIEQLQGQRVLIVGGGQSAAETVAHLLPADNQITWALRRKPLFMREPLRLPTPLFRLVLKSSQALYRLPPTLVRTLGKAIFRTTITPDLRPVYEDSRVEKIFAPAEELDLRETAEGIEAAGQTFDWVVSATGYRFLLRNLSFLSDDLRNALGDPDQPPPLDGRLESTVKNLYMIGGIAESAFGPAMRFIFGSRPAARHLGLQLSKLS